MGEYLFFSIPLSIGLSALSGEYGEWFFKFATKKFLKLFFATFNFIPYLCRRMRTTKEYIDLISAHAGELRSQFGIRSLRLFGSVSRGEQTDTSDVDVCVEMEPRLFLIVRLQRYLEDLLMCPVDVIRMHKHMNPYLLKNIEHDGIYVIQ